MTIMVNVITRDAERRVQAFTGDIEKAKKASRSGFGLPWMSKMGNQVQWAGRQLMYNFTLPLAVAGTAATKWALDNEKAMTRVAKVYGDGSAVFRKLSKTEIPALEEAFDSLSARFGVHKSDVIDIGAAWAAAGASGIQLAKATKLTLETMILGEIDAATATKNLIAIQAQYGQNVNQLAKTIDVLNMVENQTGASMADLMDGMSRAAGVARESGVSIEQLAAMISALTPAAGSAANAGNALKTIISRILSPTQDAKDLLREMGVQIDATGWNSMTATQRIEALAGEFENLSDAQKAHMATVIGSRWQLNRIIVLMRAVRNENSYYQKSLRATADEEEVFRQKQYELNKVLSSNPQRIKQAWEILQNAMTDVIQPLLPLISYLASEVARLGHAFTDLGGGTQKLVILLLLLLAAVGPIVRYVGALVSLGGILTAVFHGLAAAAVFLSKVLYKYTIGALVKLVFMLGAPIVAALRIFYINFAVAIGTTAKLFPAFLARLKLFMVAVALEFRVGLAVVMAQFTVFTRVMTVMWSAAFRGYIKITTAALTSIRAIMLFFATSTLTLFGTLFSGLGKMIVLFAKKLINPWVAATLAIIAVIYHFRDKLVQAWNATLQFLGSAGKNVMEVLSTPFTWAVDLILKAFWALPKGIRDALLTVLRIVQDIVLQVYEWMSYLNPFARHSPSLVDNVTSGIDVITKQFARLGSTGSIFDKAYSHLAKFNKEMGGVGKFADDRKTAGNKGLFDAMISDLKVLYPLLRRQEAAFTAQQRVVDALDARLSDARYELNKLEAAYSGYQNALQDFASAPIKGMNEFNNSIFENELAQKKLQLQMAQWEQVNGSVDNLRDRLSLLQGDIESLTGEAANLRSKGAGSDILGPIQDQIAALEAQANAVRNTVKSSPVSQIQSQLEALQKEGEMLQLQYDIKYDPLTRQIEQLANAQKELDYATIVEGIKRNKAAMDSLQPSLDAAQHKYDAISKQYDDQRHKLDQLNLVYAKTRDTVNELESALNSMGQAGAAAADRAGRKAGETVSTFRAGAGGNWPDPGGSGVGFTRKSMKDQSAAIREFADGQLAEMNKIFGGFDMFGPVKKAWRTAWEWIKGNVGPVVGAVAGVLSSAWSSAKDAVGGGDFWSSIVDGAKWVGDQVTRIFDLFRPDAERVWKAITDAGSRAADKLGPALEELYQGLKSVWEGLWPILKRLWAILKPILKILAGAFIIALKAITGIISTVLNPVFDIFIDVLAGVIKIVGGVLRVLGGLLKLFTAGGWKETLNAFADIFVGVWDIISGVFIAAWGVIRGVVELVVKVVWGFVKGIWEALVWLWDVTFGHSIIPDFVDAFFFWFSKLTAIPKWLWNNVALPIYRTFVRVWENFLKPFLSKLLSLVKGIFALWFTLARWVWDNILKPIFNRVKSLWTDFIKPELGKWFDRIKSVWDSLTKLAHWVKVNVMDPVFDKFKEGWNKIKDWLTNNKDMLMSPVKSIVNTVIKGINTLTKGLNKLSDILPGDINWHIGSIPEFAKGGKIPKRRVGRGFITNGARAIVGEGRKSYPEFVIPTDPTHRRRAVSLLSMAANRLRLPGGGLVAGETKSDRGRVKRDLYGGIPTYGIGGWLGDVAKGAWDNVKGASGKAAGLAFKPFKTLAEAAVSKVPWNVPKAIGKAGIGYLDKWVGGLDSAMKGPMSAALAGGIGSTETRRALSWAKTQAGKPYVWGAAGPNGYDCSGFMAAIMNVIDGTSPYRRRGSTSTMPWTGMKAGATGKAGFNLGWFTGTPGHTAGTLGGVNLESAGGVGVRIGGPVGYNSGMFNHVAHYTKAAQGAIVKASASGSLVLAGEGGRDEAVTPLPPGWRNSAQRPAGSSGDTFNFYGDLEFPNITSGEDAKTFVDNLKKL